MDYSEFKCKWIEPVSLWNIADEAEKIQFLKSSSITRSGLNNFSFYNRYYFEKYDISPKGTKREVQLDVE